MTTGHWSGKNSQIRKCKVRIGEVRQGEDNSDMRIGIAGQVWTDHVSTIQQRTG